MNPLLNPANWIIIACTFVLIEMVTGAGVALALAISCTLTALVAFTFGITSVVILLAWFVAFSVVSVYITWKWFKRISHDKQDIND